MAKRGETKEKILIAATKVFFEYGYEATSVKMIIEEAGIVTGSFYHFFPSKEALFEAVVAHFLQGYSERISTILSDSSMSFDQVVNAFLNELQSSMKIYYDVLQGDKLHWTVQASLNALQCNSMVEMLAVYFSRMKSEGKIEYLIDEDDKTVAQIFFRGSEAIIHSGDKKRVNKKALKAKLLDFWSKIIRF
jgi:AcrR family transcriptional regulator